MSHLSGRTSDAGGGPKRKQSRFSLLVGSKAVAGGRIVGRSVLHRGPKLFVGIAVVVVLLAATGALVAVAASTTSTIPPPFSEFGVSPAFDAAGDPVPAVGMYPDGAGSAIHWSMCAPPDTTVCVRLATANGAAKPGPEPAGTVFTMTASYQGKTYTGSETWHGEIRPVVAPVLRGGARVGSRVTPAAASWSGGWGSERDQLGVEACRTTAGTGCVMLSGGPQECPGPHEPTAAVIGPWFTGWYVFAIDARNPSEVACALPGYGSEAAIRLWKRAATVARSAALRVTGPPAPMVRIFRTAVVQGNHVIIASVRCSTACHVWLSVGLTGKHLVSGQRALWSANKIISGTSKLGVWGLIPAGRVLVTVNIGDGPFVNSYTKMP